MIQAVRTKWIITNRAHAKDVLHFYMTDSVDGLILLANVTSNLAIQNKVTTVEYSSTFYKKYKWKYKILQRKLFIIL